MSAKSIVPKVSKSANTVRVSASKTSVNSVPRKNRISNVERPGVGGVGASRAGNTKTSNNVGVQKFSSNMNKKSNKKPRDPAKTASKAMALKSKIDTQISSMDMPVPSAQERECLDEYIHMFQTLQEMIRIGEDRYMTSQSTREVYALMTMYSQLREVIADIRSLTDMSTHADSIVKDIIQPTISSIAQSMVDAFYHVRILVREISKDSEVQYGVKKIDDIMRDQGLMLQNQYQVLSERIHEMMTQH